MGKNKWIFVGVITGYLVFFMACKREVSHDNQVYLSQAGFLSSQRLTLNVESNLTIVVSTIYPVNNDIAVNMEVDNSLIDAYNTTNNTKLKPVPEGYYKLSSSTAVIPAGNAIGNVVLTVTGWPDYDARSRYMVPVKIARSQNLPVLKSSSVVYVLIDKIVSRTAAIGQFEIPDVAKGVAAAEYTVEGSFNVINGDYNCNDPYSVRISTIMVPDRALSVYSNVASEGEGSFRLRLGNSIDVNDITYGTRLKQGDWCHFAYTYKTGSFALYVNGQLVGIKASSIAPQVGVSQLGCGNNFAFGEVRIWSKARTQAQIADNMCGTDPSDPDLLAYWSFDRAGENNPNEFTDLTPNKLIAVRKSTGVTSFIAGECPY